MTTYLSRDCDYLYHWKLIHERWMTINQHNIFFIYVFCSFGYWCLFHMNIKELLGFQVVLKYLNLHYYGHDPFQYCQQRLNFAVIMKTIICWIVYITAFILVTGVTTIMMKCHWYEVLYIWSWGKKVKLRHIWYDKQFHYHTILK